MNGWMGKILRVDLTTGNFEILPTMDYALKYLGGRGLASRLYWERVRPETSAYDPGNRLCFMTGPLLAAGAQGCSRMSVSGKSPMAYPEAYCYGSLGGLFPAQVKRAGWDGIVLDGKSDRPQYLVIEDEKVSLQNASHLWGRTACTVEAMLEKSHGSAYSFITTGPAGENRVRTATLYASHKGTVTAGFGAVMASKNLKAVVVKGTGKVTAADPKRVKELAAYTRELKDTVSLAILPKIGETGHGHLVEALGQRHCYQCALTCSKYVYRIGGDKTMTGLRGCQSMEYYLPWIYGQEDELKTFFDAPELANDYSIGTFELMPMIEWLWECFQKGVFTDDEIGLPLSKMGTREFLESLLHGIAYREGFGAVLAEGMVRAKAQIKPEAATLYPRSVAPIGATDGVPPRAFIAHALLYPFEPRMHPISTHEIDYLSIPWSIHQADPSASNLTPDHFLEIARKWWGSEEAADQTHYRGKAMAARNIQNRTYLRDSLGLCDFIYPITYSFSRFGPVGDPNLEGNIFTAITGQPASELEAFAERIFNMQRLIQAREGRRIPEDDYPPEFNFTQPFDKSIHGVKLSIPGPGAQPVDATGRRLDRDKFSAMLEEYYDLRGWNIETGLPDPETLKSLGMDDMVDALGNINEKTRIVRE
ncbi:MAG: aldehyde ferredoxin oxidoreductase N-terminal domain-containing protein [Acidobacteriota bacterium]